MITILKFQKDISKYSAFIVNKQLIVISNLSFRDQPTIFMFWQLHLITAILHLYDKL